MGTSKGLFIFIVLVLLLSLSVSGWVYLSPQVRQQLSRLPLLNSITRYLTTTPPTSLPTIQQTSQIAPKAEFVAMSPLKPTPIPFAVLADVNDSEAMVTYAKTYPAYINNELKIYEGGFYTHPLHPESPTLQLYLYGLLKEWDTQTGKLTVDTPFGPIKLQADPNGIYLAPLKNTQVITDNSIPQFLYSKVTAWVTVENGALYVNRLALTRY